MIRTISRLRQSIQTSIYSADDILYILLLQQHCLLSRWQFRPSWSPLSWAWWSVRSTNYNNKARTADSLTLHLCSLSIRHISFEQSSRLIFRLAFHWLFLWELLKRT